MKLQHLKSEVEDGESALETETKVCSFLDIQRGNAQTAYEQELLQNDKAVKDRSMNLKMYIAELQQLKKEKTVLGKNHLKIIQFFCLII